MKTSKDAKGAAGELLSNISNKMPAIDQMRLFWKHLDGDNISILDATTAFLNANYEKSDIEAAVLEYQDYVDECKELKRKKFLYIEGTFFVGVQAEKKHGDNDDDDDEGGGLYHLVCSPLRIRGTTVDAKTGEFGTVIAVEDRFGKWNEVVLSQAELFGDGDKWLKKLVGKGLTIEKNRLPDVKHLIHSVKNNKKIVSVEQIGWMGDVFVLPTRTIPPSTNVRFAGDVPSYKISNSGTLEEWKDNVAKDAEHNSRVATAICASLAGVLLEPLGLEGGGFHFVGGSSTGKTTCLEVGSSVWGKGKDYFVTWRSTDNAMESIAYRHNDVALFLDEVGQSDKSLGATIYMLANGAGKGRMKASAEAKPILTWSTIFVSTGEVEIADRIESFGSKSTAGQGVRVIDIPADAGRGFGIFDVTGGQSGAEMSNALKASASLYYGTAGPAFIEHLAEELEVLKKIGPENIDKLARQFVPKGADGQVERVARRFALIAFAGEIASYFGILPWKKGAATKAVDRCFTDWLTARGTIGALEPHKGKEAVLKFIAAHGYSKFRDLESHEAGGNFTTIDQVGWRKKENLLDSQARKTSVYFIDSARWKDVCGSYAPTATAQALLESDYLIHESFDELTVRRTFPGQGRKRYYAVRMDDDRSLITSIAPPQPLADKPEQSTTHECEADFDPQTLDGPEQSTTHEFEADFDPQALDEPEQSTTHEFDEDEETVE